MIAIQETESETVQNRPHNFEEFYQEWLSAPWIGHPGQINADRDPTALSNHRRALKVLSLSSGFTGILNETPISAINLSAELIGVRLADGLKLEAIAKGKVAPKPGLVGNMVSIARGLALYAVNYDNSNFQSGFALRKLLTQKRRVYQERFAYSDCPAKLQAEIKKHQDWLRSAILPSAEAHYRPKRMAEDTIRNHRTVLGPYIRWRIETGLPSERLSNLIRENEFSRYLNDVFVDRPGIERRIGGHKAAYARAIAVAAIIRYLVATDQIDPVTGNMTPEEAVNRPERSLYDLKIRSDACDLRKGAFYELGKAILRHGASEESLVTKHKPPAWVPKDMQNICDEGFQSPARTCQSRAGSSIQRFTRKRSAIMFGLSAETPLRIRTLSLIDWKDFQKLPNGRWKIRVPASKLKIRNRKNTPNTYTMVYSKKMSKYIDEYRKVLEDYFGPSFELDVPWIFPTINMTNNKGRQGTRETLGRGMTHLALELRNVLFSPHDARYIVATYAIHKMGAPGIMLAAKLLGDKPETILEFYVKEIQDGAKEIEDYLDGIQQ